MTLTSLLPWSRTRSVPSRLGGDGHRFSLFDEEMRSMLDEFLRDFDWEPWTVAVRRTLCTPCIDIHEQDDMITVSAELPGMERDDVDLSITHNTVTLRGEKKCKCEEGEKGSGFYRRERSYGCFHRTVMLPADIEIDKVEATFHNGVLTVTCPKTREEVESSKHVEIKSG